jgi:hypothetical protein
MFSAYFDASGTSDTRVVTVAGFVSRLSKWERFEPAWRLILQSANPRVTMFHMTDFVTSANGWEEWKSGKSTERAKLIEDLVVCIRKHTNKGFANSIQTAHYRIANAEYRIAEELGNAYAVASMGCLGGLKKWAAKNGIDYRKVLVIFEDGDTGQGEMIAKVRSEGYNAVPQSKKAVRAFDACDLVAWKAKSLIDDSYERMLWKTNPDSAGRVMAALNQLESVVHSDTHTLMTSDGLIRACQAILPMPIGRRGQPVQG